MLRFPSSSATVHAARRHCALTAQTLRTFATEAEGLQRVNARPFFSSFCGFGAFAGMANGWRRAFVVFGGGIRRWHEPAVRSQSLISFSASGERFPFSVLL
jgi:hypothetical protein